MKTVLILGSSLIAAAMFQMPTTPPMRMGLWESNVNMKMTGMAMPMGLGSRTTNVRVCLTPESYAKALASSGQQKDCVRSNEVWTPKKMSMDLSCRNGQATGHVEMFFDSPEASHGTVSLNMNTGAPTPIQMQSTTAMHFISTDCGTVTPDKPQIVK